MPTAASAKPSIIDAMVLAGGSLLVPTKLQGEQLHREELGRAELQRELRQQRREEGDQQHREQRADERRRERRRQRLCRAALLGHRVAVEGGGHRPRLAGDVEQDRRDRPAEQRAPIDTGQHDDR
jgi:hypothetical protein